MKYTTTLLLLALFTICFIFFVSASEDDFADEDEGIKYNDKVIILTDDNFDEKIKEHEYILVEFYANWCPHCKALGGVDGVISTAANMLEEENVNAKIATIECDKNNKKCSEYQIPGFPSLKLFKGGEDFKDFEEGREAQDIVNWLKRKTGPAAVPLDSEDAEKEFVATQQKAEVSAVVGVFKNKDSDLYKQFIASAEKNDDFAFAERIGADSDSITLFQYFGGALNIEATDSTGILTFVQNNGYPLVDEINAKTFKRFAEAGIPLSVLFFSYKNDGDNKKTYTAVLTEAAKALQGKMNFGYSDGDEFAGQLEMMTGEKFTGAPSLAGMDIETRKNYPYKGELNADDITKWGSGIVDGSVKPFLKSQPVPEEDDEAIITVVGSNFNERVIESDRDTFLMAHAEWCGHCKKLMPIVEKVAEYFQSIEGVDIVRIDASENDISADGVQIEGFPTIYFFPAGSKDTPIAYDGERTGKAIKKFIYENSGETNKAAIKALIAKNKAAKKEKDEL